MMLSVSDAQFATVSRQRRCGKLARDSPVVPGILIVLAPLPCGRPAGQLCLCAGRYFHADMNCNQNGSPPRKNCERKMLHFCLMYLKMRNYSVDIFIGDVNSENTKNQVNFGLNIFKLVIETASVFAQYIFKKMEKELYLWWKGRGEGDKI